MVTGSMMALVSTNACHWGSSVPPSELRSLLATQYSLFRISTVLISRIKVGDFKENAGVRQDHIPHHQRKNSSATLQHSCPPMSDHTDAFVVNEKSEIATSSSAPQSFCMVSSGGSNQLLGTRGACLVAFGIVEVTCETYHGAIAFVHSMGKSDDLRRSCSPNRRATPVVAEYKQRRKYYIRGEQSPSHRLELYVLDEFIAGSIQ